MTAQVHIPSVSDGHITVTFDNQDTAETIRAERIVMDMLKRGYMLIVETEPGKWERAEAFDPKTNEYVIADLGTNQEESDDLEGQQGQEESSAKKTPAKKTSASKRQPRAKQKRVSAKGTQAVGVSKTAGG